MKKNSLWKSREQIIRVLDVKNEKVFVIDCVKRTMPYWVMRDRLVEKMKEKQGVTEQLKAENQMMWVGKMNNIIACAEEIVVREVVYV